MQAEMALARRAYEWGRLRASLPRSLYVVVPVGVVAYVVTGASSLVWLPVTFAAWLLAHWRGGPLLRGAFFGLAGGAITYALPMTLLRPCCSPELMMAGKDCCTQPSACVGAGALLGLALAAFVPLGTARVRTATGMVLGVSSVAVLRCSTLFAAEAGGLIAGLAAGVIAATLARMLLGRTTTAAR